MLTQGEREILQCLCVGANWDPAALRVAKIPSLATGLGYMILATLVGCHKVAVLILTLRPELAMLTQLPLRVTVTSIHTGTVLYTNRYIILRQKNVMDRQVQETTQ